MKTLLLAPPADRTRCVQKAALLAIALCTPALCTPRSLYARATEPRPHTALDLYHLRTASDVALSPDGQRVAYVATEVHSTENRYRCDLYLGASAG